jgi:hypothetical protein
MISVVRNVVATVRSPKAIGVLSENIVGLSLRGLPPFHQ